MGNSYRVRFASALAAIVLLASCSDQRTWSEAEISDIAQDAAGDTSCEPTDTSAIEARLDAIDKAIAEQSRDIAKLAQLDVEESRENRAEFQRLSDNDEAFRQQVNYLRALRGLAPMPVK